MSRKKFSLEEAKENRELFKVKNDSKNVEQSKSKKKPKGGKEDGR